MYQERRRHRQMCETVAGALLHVSRMRPKRRHWNGITARLGPDAHLVTGYLDVPALECIDHECSPRVVQPVEVRVPGIQYSKTAQYFRAALRQVCAAKQSRLNGESQGQQLWTRTLHCEVARQRHSGGGTETIQSDGRAAAHHRQYQPMAEKRGRKPMKKSSVTM